MLRDLIDWLEKQNPDAIVPHGFGSPMSYRGNFQDLAFEPVKNARLGDMLLHARSALGRTFDSYKGGGFTMREYTDCWIAEYGGSGLDADKIGPTMMKLWEFCAASRGRCGSRRKRPGRQERTTAADTRMSARVEIAEDAQVRRA